MSDSSYMIDPGATAEEQATKRKIAMALMQQGMDGSPIQHWAQGLGRMAQSAMGGYELYRADKDDKEETAKGNALLAALWGPQGGQVSPPPAISSPVASSSLSGDPSQPRGIRNNNPLNIEAGGFTQGQPGFNGSDGRFAKFETPEQGVGAANALLDVYQNKHGLNTVAGIVGRWAPSSDGNNVSAYAANVAKQLGIGPNDPIPPEMRPKLIAAMGQHENGQPIGNVATALAPQDPAALPPNSQPTQFVVPGSGPQPAQPVQTAQATPNREAIIRMLGNRKTAPIARSIISAQIGQQFKPSEYDFKERPDGTLVAVDKKNPKNVHVVDAPGGGQQAIDFAARKAGAVTKAEAEAKREVAAPDKRQQELLSGGIVVQDIDRAIKEMDRATLPTTGAIGSAASYLPGTSAHNVSKLVETVKANAGFNELNKMRAASPTGGALGSITEKELSLLQSTIGNLEQSQSDEQFRDNLKRVKNVYMDIIHGPGNGPREKLGFEQPAAPDRAALEAEMKRRGLLK